MLQFNDEEMSVMDEVAKELFARRLFNIRDMSDAEVQAVGVSCYGKAHAFVLARRAFLETV